MTLAERKEQLNEQLKQAEVNYHQIVGAIAILDQQIKDEEEPVKTKKDIMKK